MAVVKARSLLVILLATVPSIGELVTLDVGTTILRVLRSSDGSRIYAAEVAAQDGS